MEFGKRHDTTDTTDVFQRQLNCCGLVTDLLRGTGVMDFGLNLSEHGEFVMFKLLSTLATVVAEFGDNSATVAVSGVVANVDRVLFAAAHALPRNQCRR